MTEPPLISMQPAVFAVHNDTVSMTKRAAETGDEFGGVTADGRKAERPVNPKFLSKRVPSIHVIDPNRPVGSC